MEDPLDKSNPTAILVKAIERDKAGCLLEAHNLYYDGANMLKQLAIVETNAKKRDYFELRIKEYLDRSNAIMNIFKKTGAQELLSLISIEQDSQGYSYQSLFGTFLDEKVKEIWLEEPYLYGRNNFVNLIAFLEVVVKNCKNLRYICIVTKPDVKGPEIQQTTLNEIKADIENRNISVNIKFESCLHDRCIIIGNSFIVRMGRGLHIYKPREGNFTLGCSDYDFRHCLKTEVQIMRVKEK